MTKHLRNEIGMGKWKMSLAKAFLAGRKQDLGKQSSTQARWYYISRILGQLWGSMVGQLLASSRIFCPICRPINSIAWCLSAFFIVSHLPLEDFAQVGSSLAFKYTTKVTNTLPCYGINYDRKKFDETIPLDRNRTIFLPFLVTVCVRNELPSRCRPVLRGNCSFPDWSRAPKKIVRTSADGLPRAKIIDFLFIFQAQSQIRPFSVHL